jgi:hypothetical protein
MLDFMPTSSNPTGYIALEASHANDCSCPDLVSNNNLPALVYSLACLPKNVRKFHGATNKTKSPLLAIATHPVTLNQTILFYDVASKQGTVCGRILQRQSLAQLARDTPRLWRQPYSDIPLLNRVNLLLGLIAQVAKQEFSRFVANFESEEGLSTEQQDFRFPDKSTQEQCPDIGLRHDTARPLLDTILNNSVFVAPFRGLYCCPYCPKETNKLRAKGITSLITHLAEHHKKLLTAWFSCPACVATTIVDWDTYIQHYQRHHEQGAALMVVLDETLSHSRNCWATAMASYIATTNIWLNAANRKEIKSTEQDFTFSAIGGYAAKHGMSAHKLMSNIQGAQLNLILNEEVKKDLKSLWHQQLLRQADPHAAATPAHTATHSAALASQDQATQQQPDLETTSGMLPPKPHGWTDPAQQVPDQARTPTAASKMVTAPTSPEPGNPGYCTKPRSVSQPPLTTPSTKTPEDATPKTVPPIRIPLKKRNPPRKPRKLQETDPLHLGDHPKESMPASAGSTSTRSARSSKKVDPLAAAIQAADLTGSPADELAGSEDDDAILPDESQLDVSDKEDDTNFANE